MLNKGQRFQIIPRGPRRSPSREQPRFGRAEASAQALQHLEPEDKSDQAKQLTPSCTGAQGQNAARGLAPYLSYSSGSRGW